MPALSIERAVLSHCSYEGKFSFFSVYADSRRGCFLLPCLHCTHTTPRQGCFSSSHLYCSYKKLLPSQVSAVLGSSVMFLDRAVSTFYDHIPPRKSCFPVSTFPEKPTSSFHVCPAHRKIYSPVFQPILPIERVLSTFHVCTIPTEH